MTIRRYTAQALRKTARWLDIPQALRRTAERLDPTLPTAAQVQSLADGLYKVLANDHT